MGALKEPVLNLYETDFAAWALAQAKALERKEWGALDVANLVEELESMGVGAGVDPHLFAGEDAVLAMTR
jgi:Domain of unknown function DUF29